MTEANGNKIRPHRVPKEWRTPPANPGTLILMLGGILLACVGVVAAAGTELFSGLEPYVTMAARYGVEAGTFFVGGLVLVGLGMVSSYQRSSSKRLLQDGPTADALEEVFTELAEILEHVERLHNEQTHVRQEIGNVKHQVTKQREESKTNDSKDALFRLAASLDQLGARLDQRIGKASSEVHEGLYELTSIVESSRDFLQEGLESTTREVRDSADRVIRVASTPVQPVYMPHPGMYPPGGMPGPHPQQGHDESDEYDVPSQYPDFDSNNYEVYDQVEEEEYEGNDAEEELRILVELEDEVEDEEEQVKSGLGLLDELDDYGERTQAEKEEESKRAESTPEPEPKAPAAPPTEPDTKDSNPGPALPSPAPPMPMPRPLGTLDEGMRGRLDQIKTLLEGDGIEYPSGPQSAPPSGDAPA